MAVYRFTPEAKVDEERCDVLRGDGAWIGDPLAWTLEDLAAAHGAGAIKVVWPGETGGDLEVEHIA